MAAGAPPVGAPQGGSGSSEDVCLPALTAAPVAGAVAAKAPLTAGHLPSALDTLHPATPMVLEEYYTLHGVLGSACAGRVSRRRFVGVVGSGRTRTAPPCAQRADRARCTWRK